MQVKPANRICGEIEVPGDKSLSHRSLIFSSLAQGQSVIEKPLKGQDVLSTKSCLEALGVQITEKDDRFIVNSPGIDHFTAPMGALDCGNSGTTIRLLMGLLAGLPFDTMLVGDESLSKRPMKRVSEPLSLMGGEFELTNGDYPPLTVKGRKDGKKLKGINYALQKASAQIKSAIMIAALSAEGETTLTGKIQSRDHTERLLPHFGGKLAVSNESIKVAPQRNFTPNNFTIPGDPSSVAFWIAAVLLLENSEMTFKNVLLNKTRLGFIEVVKRMGAEIKIEFETETPEPVGTISVKSSPIKGVEVFPEEIPSLIDEIPILMVLATKARGTTKVTGAKELRVKESDRLQAMEDNLIKMGIKLTCFEDGFTLEGEQSLKGGAEIETFHDHRIAMAFSIAALSADAPITIKDHEIVNVSYPGFY